MDGKPANKKPERDNLISKWTIMQDSFGKHMGHFMWPERSMVDMLGPGD